MELDFLPSGSDPLAYTISALKSCRIRWFHMLWSDPNIKTDDLMAMYRSTAWLILNEDKPQTKKDIYNACQRRLYRAAKDEGFHRERGLAMRYGDRMNPVGLMQDDDELNAGIPSHEGALRSEVIAKLIEWFDPLDVAIIGGLVADMEVSEIASDLRMSPEEVELRRKFIQLQLKEKKYESRH